MRGFIGPIGDDLPSILVLLVSLSLFFSSLSFALNSYNDKFVNFNKLKGLMAVGDFILSKGLLPSSTTALSLKNDVKPIALSYDLDYCISFNSAPLSCSQGTACKDGWVHFNYLIPYLSSSGGNELKILGVCGG